jgi:2-amino-4-hydroxy-6-hydroxymethyldihydropteridine diphosphokinase
MRNSNTIPAYIGLGSNLGDREANLKHALALLIETPHVELRRISAFHENAAVGGPEDAPDFINAAAEVHTTLTPHALMKRLLEIEHQMGRNRREKWEPRSIDLDLLLFGNSIVSDDALIVPHPLMHERRFVIKPLSEIAANVIHPTLQMTIAGILNNLERPRQNGK